VTAAIDIPVLETERLRLRAWREDDLDPLAAFYASDANARFVGGVCARDDAWRRMAMFLGHWALRGYGNWVIEEKGTGIFAGYCGLWSPESWPEPELMWGLAPASQGKGYATEAATRARRFAYETLRWPTLVSLIVPENEPSRRVSARLGARIERTIELRGYRMDVHRHPVPEQLN
jgi:RimJ/RimL family protein N-acetyltransferase